MLASRVVPVLVTAPTLIEQSWDYWALMPPIFVGKAIFTPLGASVIDVWRSASLINHINKHS
jgi:hypothetical protein